MEATMDRMSERTRQVGGVATSFLDLGYRNVGLDDNWQACGAGYLGSFHDQTGKPIVNLTRFPSMKGMTSYGHKKGLRVGWYFNNCICAEQMYLKDVDIANNMEKSAAAVAEYGFDGLKLDGCGQFRNLTWWAELVNKTGRPVLLENCHWGETIPGDTKGDGPCTGITTISDCPYNT
jgi:alpha-galactosidase